MPTVPIPDNSFVHPSAVLDGNIAIGKHS